MNTVALGDVVRIVGGGTPSRSNPAFYNGTIPWVTVKDFGDRLALCRSKETITQQGLENSASNLIPSGSVLLVARMAVGRAAINLVDVSINQDVKALMCGPKLDAKYLLFFLRSRQSYLEEQGEGATVKGITLDLVRDLRVPLPSLSEQKRIAVLLDKADHLRRSRRYAQELCDSFLQSVFLEMFGDPMKNPMRWDVSLLEDLGTLDRGRSRHRPRNASQLLGGPYPLIQTGEVANSDGYIRTYKQTYSEMGLQQSKMWPKGTLCITIAANIAKTGILLFDACFPDSVVGFTANFKTNAEYVQQWFSFMQQHLERIAPESAQKNINLEILHGLQVPLPPLKLQKKFAEVVRRVERLRAQQREAARQAEHLFQTLLHRAFSDNAERILELQAPT